MGIADQGLTSISIQSCKNLNGRPTMKRRLLTINILSLAAIFLLVGSGEMATAAAQTHDRVVAVVNGREITQEEVDNSLVSQLFPLEQQIYALRRAALDNLVLKTILEEEAKKRVVSVEEVRRLLTAGKIEVSPSQVEEVYAENASVFASMSPDEAKQRLLLDLESQARMQNYRTAISKLKEASRIEIRLEEPRLPSVSGGDSPSIGVKEAAVTIIEFSDFQCPYCRESHGILKHLLQDYRNEVRLVFKHLPLDIHAEAFTSARAAFCAGAQGLFWQYHDALFTAPALSSEGFSRAAADLGLSLPRFKACVGSEASSAAVRKDMREAQQMGINSTPTFIVNGKLLRGAIGFEEFKAVIERELKAARGASYKP